MNMILIASPVIIATLWIRVKSLINAAKTKTNVLMEFIYLSITLAISAALIYFIITRLD